jgi:hypothetical protein
MDHENIDYRKEPPLAYVTINRPQVMNAMDPPTSAAMARVWQDFVADDSLLVGILTGAGEKAFCAGADLKYRLQHPGYSYGRGEQSFPQQWGGLVRTHIPKPIIAAINGYCLGGGLELALACDIAVASETATFGFPEVRNAGTIPGSGGTLRIPRQIPLKIAMWLLLSGERMTAQGREGPGVRVEQHFMALTGVGHQPECPTGAELQVRHLHLPVDAADHQMLFAPVKLKGFAQGEMQRDERLRRLAFPTTPGADERGELAVATDITIRFDLRQQRLGRAPILFGAVAIGRERLFQGGVKCRQPVRHLAPAILRRGRRLLRAQPTADRVARQSRALRYFVQRQFVAPIQPSNLAQYFHGDHPCYLLPKN